jgi:trimeric autotransporter adhesin
MALRKLVKLSAIASALILAGCGGDLVINAGNGSDGGNNGGGTPPPAAACPAFATQGASLAGVTKAVCEISGTLTSDIRLTADIAWSLNGKVSVGNDNASNATLTIEPGTTLFGKSGADYLVVARGSKIQAVGTVSAPIIMTSVNDMLGLSDDESTAQWGGLVLLGNAPTNKCDQADLSSCQVQAEGDAGPYGGANADDSSGALKYLQVRYAGYEVLPDNELNGITFAGVGRGTTVEYIQVHNNLDDGVEFFGGTVDAKYVVLTGNRDDSLDWADGWTGRMQHVLVRHNPNNSKANRGIEADNQSGNFTAQPVSKPRIANMTIIGNSFDGEDDSEGVLLRAGTAAELYNFIITGPAGMGECFEINSDESVTNAGNGEIVFRNSIIDCVEPFKNSVDSNNNVTLNAASWFLAQPGNMVTDALLGGYVPAPNSPALANGYNVANNVDNWFDNVDYIGAFDGSTDWTKGWTVGLHADDDLATCPAGTTEVNSLSGRLNCQLAGDITSNVTLAAGADYVLSGRVRIGVDNTTAATLTVQPGVRIFGKSGADFLVVTRGSKINAQGTAANPIVMTSVQDIIGSPTAAGQWGGLVLLGKAPSNKCDQADLANCEIQAEGDAGPYGGDNWADSSGVLKYVVVKHAGFEVIPDNELNGITFAGVGSGTECANIQVHQNVDDGIEMFGGAVSCKNVVLTANGDDSVDWADGWRGKLQFVLVKHAADGGKANRGIEGDNQSGNFSALPLSNPTIANMTIIGNSFDGDDDSEGILLRAGTSAQLANVVVSGPAGMGECLEFDSAPTKALAAAGSLTMSHSVIACPEPFKGELDNGVTTEQWFLSQPGNSTATGMANVLDGIFTIDTRTPKDMAAEDNFFDAVDFIGAVKAGNDWTAGWAVGLDD